MIYNFLKCSTFYYLLYPIFTHILSYNSKFKELSNNKKNYVIKNLVKSLGLFYLFINFLHIILNNNFEYIFNDEYINFMGAVYVGNDFIGLIRIPDLPKSTKIHHIITNLLYLFTIFTNVKDNDLGLLIILYCIFSFIPYSVNTYLGLRYLINDKKILYANKKIAKYSYILSCLINWTYHIYFFSYKISNNMLNLSHISYIFIIGPVIYDDIYLIRWLNK